MTSYELRWNLGYGYMRLRLTDEGAALQIMALTRGCGQGFALRLGGDGAIWSKTLTGSDATIKLLRKAGYADPKQL